MALEPSTAELTVSDARSPIRSWLMDMDGVLVHEEDLIPGADRFVAILRERQMPFLVLTNNSLYTRRDLSARLRKSGIEVPEQAIFTSALATARFLADQRPGGSAFVIGEVGLTTALHSSGYTLTERDPDYVVVGETRTYSFSRITQAVRHVQNGARFIATNPDPSGPSSEGPLPATGSLASLISTATGVSPYFVGKPNPLMMRTALNAIGAHSESTVMIGDSMHTDIVAGLEAGLETILVLSGVTSARRRPLPLPPVAHRRLDRRPHPRGRAAGRSVVAPSRVSTAIGVPSGRTSTASVPAAPTARAARGSRSGTVTGAGVSVGGAVVVPARAARREQRQAGAEQVERRALARPRRARMRPPRSACTSCSARAQRAVAGRRTARAVCSATGRRSAS